jgi:hypothetical protein
MSKYNLWILIFSYIIQDRLAYQNMPSHIQSLKKLYKGVGFIKSTIVVFMTVDKLATGSGRLIF